MAHAALWLSVLAGATLTLAACADGEGTRATEITPPPRATAAPTAGGPTAETTTPRSCDGVRPEALVFCADVSGMERASVVAIIDGDTFDVTIDGRPERIRIFGIDTPERGDRCFAEASMLLESLAGSDVRLQTDERTVDRSGRLLRYVYRPDGLSIDAVMIAAGAAHAWTRDGALRDELVALEERARREQIGCLWR